MTDSTVGMRILKVFIESVPQTLKYNFIEQVALYMIKQTNKQTK